MNIRKLKQGWYVELECKALVPEGLGLAHLDREQFGHLYKPLTGFVWGVLPGEKFVARVTRSHGGYFHAVIAEQGELPADWVGKTSAPKAHPRFALYNISPERKEPDCENFTLCGGCKLLHLPYENSLEYKKQWLATQLMRQNVGFPDILVCAPPKTTGYRNHVQVHINLHKERGFYAPYSYRVKAFPKAGCLLFNQPLFDRAFPNEYVLERCVRSRIDNKSQTVLTLPLHSQKDKTSTFTYHVDFPLASTTALSIPNPSFFQINSEALPQWLTTIQGMIGQSDGPALNVLELFSGFGFISRMLSLQRALDVTGVDIIAKNEVERVKIINDDHSSKMVIPFAEQYIQADLHDAAKLPTILNKTLQSRTFDLLLMNPPRGGLPPASVEYFLSTIQQSKDFQVVYSSCNAATMARDLGAFQSAGFFVQQIELFDFFPFTSHYEVVALLRTKTIIGN